MTQMLQLYFVVLKSLNIKANVLCPMDDKESFCVGQKCNYSSLDSLWKGEIFYSSLTSMSAFGIY